MGKVVRYQKGPWGSQRRRRRQPDPEPSWAARILLALAIGAGVGWFGYSYFGAPIIGCDIKGNISVRSGERIYHVPGQDYYFRTRIDVLKGERYFCSEAEARAAGWRKSRV